MHVCSNQIDREYTLNGSAFGCMIVVSVRVKTEIYFGLFSKATIFATSFLTLTQINAAIVPLNKHGQTKKGAEKTLKDEFFTAVV